MAYVADQTTPATGDAAMRRFKDRAKLQGWTVPSSSDGLTYNATGDQITTDSGAGSFAANGAWLRLKMVGATRELLFQRGATSRDWRVLYSVLAFSGGTPGTTRVPTSTEEQILFGGGTDAAPTYGTMLGADGTFRLNVCVEDAAPYYLGMAAIPLGGGVCSGAVVLCPLRSGTYPAGDADPYVVLADGASALNGDRVRSAAFSAGGGMFGCWHKRGLAGAAWNAASCLGPAFGALSTANSVLGFNAISGEETPAEVLIGIIEGGPTFKGPKGYARDLQWVMAPTASAPYGVRLNDGTRYWIRCGDLWLPWDATIDPSI